VFSRSEARHEDGRGSVGIIGRGRAKHRRERGGTTSTWISRSCESTANMDYLRTLGSAAVSSIVQKSGLNLPFSLGKKLPPLDTLAIWSLYDATKRVNGLCVRHSGSGVLNCSTRMMEHLCPYSSLIARNGATCSRSHRMPFEGYGLRDILTFSNSWTPSKQTERYTS
jgi:hypothetical protein